MVTTSSPAAAAAPRVTPTGNRGLDWSVGGARKMRVALRGHGGAPVVRVSLVGDLGRGEVVAAVVLVTDGIVGGDAVEEDTVGISRR
jgi:hypothetical protein